MRPKLTLQVTSPVADKWTAWLITASDHIGSHRATSGYVRHVGAGTAMYLASKEIEIGEKNAK